MRQQREDAGRLLAGLENGTRSTADGTILAEKLDPVLVYVIVSFLRAIHPASDPAASAVLERVVKLTSSSPAVIQKHSEGEKDPVSRWFEEVHEYDSYRGRGDELLDLVVDKLDS